MGFINYPGLQGVDLSGGLGEMLAVEQQPQIDQANQIQNALAQAQMEEARARTGLYTAQAQNLPTGEERYASAIAKKKEAEQNDAIAKDYALLNSVKMAGSPTEQAFQFDNIAPHLSENTMKMFALPPEQRADDGKIGFNFNPDTLDTAINSVAAQHPTLNKVVTTGMKNESAETIATARNKSRELIAEQIANIKKTLAAADTPKALDTTFLREMSKISAARNKALAEDNLSEELSTALDKQELTLRKEYESIRSNYNKAIPSAASVSATPKVRPPLSSFEKK